ncbi:hypothetical protein L7F22_003495 [Adiantum nelumboides]|nr:hypothetical protein [Adiantum nelumboides]
MHDDFKKTPKQSVDLWSKVATQLAFLFLDCDKDGQACKKKWGRVYNAYKKNKAHNSISGNDRKITCDCYDILDEYMHSTANIVSESHALALGGFADEEMVEVIVLEEPHVTEIGVDGTQSSMANEKLLAGNTARDTCHRKDQKIEESLGDLTNIAKQRESDADRKVVEAERIKLLGTLTNAIAGLMDVVKHVINK